MGVRKKPNNVTYYLNDPLCIFPVRLTHATPAALYAHSASRDWECDAFMTKKTGHVLPHEEDPNPDLIFDIGRQLVHRQPGRNLFL